MLTGVEVEASFFKAGAEVAGVIEQLGAQLGGILEQIEDSQADTRHHGRDAVREQVGPRAITQPVDHFPAGRNEPAAGAAQRLAESAPQDIDSASNTAMPRR